MHDRLIQLIYSTFYTGKVCFSNCELHSIILEMCYRLSASFLRILGRKSLNNDHSRIRMVITGQSDTWDMQNVIPQIVSIELGELMLEILSLSRVSRQVRDMWTSRIVYTFRFDIVAKHVFYRKTKKKNKRINNFNCYTISLSFVIPRI